jgi:hypothetical protein
VPFSGNRRLVFDLTVGRALHCSHSAASDGAFRHEEDA